MNFDVGALVKVRGREWVVLPESLDDEDMLILRPLGRHRGRGHGDLPAPRAAGVGGVPASRPGGGHG